MILVDTSVWIDYLGREAGPYGDALEALIDAGEEVCLTRIVLTEVLQGIRSDRLRTRTLEHLAPFDRVEPREADYLRAADIYRACRRHGVTPRSTIDCLIAALCLERNARLLHHDRDFDHLARLVGLEVVEVRA